MVKTTLYLPDDLKHRLARAAADDGRSEADLIREAITSALDRRNGPMPPLAIANSGGSDYVNRMDDYMAGFGST